MEKWPWCTHEGSIIPGARAEGGICTDNNLAWMTEGKLGGFLLIFPLHLKKTNNSASRPMISPAEGLENPLSTFNRAVFPDPLWPSRAVICPSYTFKDKPGIKTGQQLMEVCEEWTWTCSPCHRGQKWHFLEAERQNQIQKHRLVLQELGLSLVRNYILIELRE